MSKQFVGFSDDDIFKITRQTSNPGRKSEDISRPHKKVPPGAVKFLPPPTVVENGNNLSTISCVDTSIYPNHPIQQAVAFKPLPSMIRAPEDESILVLPNPQQQQQQQQQIPHRVLGPVLTPPNGAGGYSGAKPAVNDVVTPFKGMSLKDFEHQRKLMEEQNRQKRAILHKAIEQHAQKTAAEANKIQEIKTELNKLDSELASDVAILRKQIDAASVHFTNVEKNYLTIENLFLKAKVELHQALERKEMLAEHLCTIISHNEERKAKRLSELMEKVGISVDGDFDDTINSNNTLGATNSTNGATPATPN